MQTGGLNQTLLLSRWNTRVHNPQQEPSHDQCPYFRLSPASNCNSGNKSAEKNINLCYLKCRRLRNREFKELAEIHHLPQLQLVFKRPCWWTLKYTFTIKKSCFLTVFFALFAITGEKPFNCERVAGWTSCWWADRFILIWLNLIKGNNFLSFPEKLGSAECKYALKIYVQEPGARSWSIQPYISTLSFLHQLKEQTLFNGSGGFLPNGHSTLCICFIPLFSFLQYIVFKTIPRSREPQSLQGFEAADKPATFQWWLPAPNNLWLIKSSNLVLKRYFYPKHCATFASQHRSTVKNLLLLCVMTTFPSLAPHRCPIAKQVKL